MSGFRRSKWRLEHLTLRDLIVLCASMREDEIEQWQALVNPEPFDFEQAAVYCFQLPGIKFGLWCGDELVVAGGYYTTHGRIMRSWMVGTQAGWDKHWRSITEATKFVMTCLLDDGAIRLETEALTSRVKTAKWYTAGIGMTFEGILRGKGFGGQNVSSFSLVAQAPVPQLEEVTHGRQ